MLMQAERDWADSYELRAFHEDDKTVAWNATGAAQKMKNGASAEGGQQYVDDLWEIESFAPPNPYASGSLFASPMSSLSEATFSPVSLMDRGPLDDFDSRNDLHLGAYPLQPDEMEYIETFSPPMQPSTAYMDGPGFEAGPSDAYVPVSSLSDQIMLGGNGDAPVVEESPYIVLQGNGWPMEALAPPMSFDGVQEWDAHAETGPLLPIYADVLQEYQASTQAAPSADLTCDNEISTNIADVETIHTDNAGGLSSSNTSTAPAQTPRYLPHTGSLPEAWVLAQAHSVIKPRLDAEAKAIAASVEGMGNAVTTSDYIKTAVHDMISPDSVLEDEKWVCTYPFPGGEGGMHICGDDFESKFERNRHVACFHILVGYIGCNYCGRAYTRSDLVQRHLKKCRARGSSGEQDPLPPPTAAAGPSTEQAPPLTTTTRMSRTKATKKNNAAATVEAKQPGHAKRRSLQGESKKGKKRE